MNTTYEREFLPIMRRYQADGTVFQSPVQGARYRITSVDGSGCEVGRIDANEPARVSVSTYETCLQKIRENGGSYAFNQLVDTVAVRTTVLQGLPFCLTSDKQTILDLSEHENAVAAFCELIQNLRVDVTHGQPRLYKPAMLASVIDALESGELAQNRIEFDWILKRFAEKMETLGIEVGPEQAAMPFFHLTGDLFWMLCYKNTSNILESGKARPSTIRERVSHAIIKDTFWSVLENPESRERALKALEEKWWSGRTSKLVSPTVRDGLENVLSKYAAARANERFGTHHDLWSVFGALRQALAKSDPVRLRPELKVTWSVGQANWAKIPWVAFLDKRETNTTQRGVYCVFLFRQDMSGVYLALNQGVTELKRQHGRKESRSILRSRAQDLRKHCNDLLQLGFALDDEIDLRADSGLGSDYEDSVIAYKLYEKQNVPDDVSILKDLDAVLNAHDKYLKPIPSPLPDFAAIHASFSKALRSSNISFGTRHDEVIRSFLASLATKRFVIITGLSGSGKTQIAIKFGEWLGNGRFSVVPVRPDWTGSESLFGYEDALQACSEDGRKAWYVPDVLKFILQAAKDPQNPYLLVLDEMNLAHVERYFADMLSGMESMQPCLPNLLSESGSWRIHPSKELKLLYPRNLFIIGTVNVDETTYMFSPKVLDRANTLEFRVETSDLLSEARKPTTCSPGEEGLVRGFRAIAEDDAWHLEHPATHQDSFLRHLRTLHHLLSEGGFEFGHRVFYEAVRFAAMLEAAGDDAPDHALDLQVMQKVLPRLHGSRKRLEPTLCGLGQFCFDLSVAPVSKGITAAEQFNPLAPLQGEARLPISFDKIQRMTRTLRANQFVSFTE
jgi:5-methylcytosine-specific restriction enzyme B